jgi:signal peptidase II
MPRRAAWFALAAAIVAFDQLSKWAVLSAFAPGERLALTSFFNLVLAFNKGAAFSFLARAPGWQTPLFIAVAVVAIVIVSVLLARSPADRLVCAGLAMILGGALGNLVDRLRYGQVVDFLDFHLYGWHWPAFNVADSAITIGAGLLIYESLLRRGADGERTR